MTGKEVLRAIADGADPSEFECSYKQETWKQFQPDNWSIWDALYSEYHTFRRKPRTRVVNGFTVPAPIQEMPKMGDMYFWAITEETAWFGIHEWRNDEGDNLWFSRGLLFSNKEAAIANAKAMCGINPESEA